MLDPSNWVNSRVILKQEERRNSRLSGHGKCKIPTRYPSTSMDTQISKHFNGYPFPSWRNSSGYLSGWA